MEDEQMSETSQVPPPPVVHTKKPGTVPLPDDLTAMQVDCGTFHTGERSCSPNPAVSSALSCFLQLPSFTRERSTSSVMENTAN